MNKEFNESKKLSTDFYRKILLSLFLLLASINMKASVIHWITFIDTKDEYVGELDLNARKILYSRFVDVVNSSLSLIGYTSDVLDFYGVNVTPDKCADIVESMKCEANDIVVFYYIGHGYHPSDDVTEYPTMVLGTNTISDKSLPLSWVHNILKGKGARLVITIGACSNVIMQSSTASKKSFAIPPKVQSQSDNSLLFSENGMSAIQRAFACTKGELVMCASSLGQGAFGGPTSMGSIDYLTAALITNFEDLTYENIFSWESLLKETQTSVWEITNGKQTPFFYYNLKQSPMNE